MKFIILHILLYGIINAGLLSPENHIELHYTHIAFEWEQEADADLYNLQVSTASDFENIIVNITDPTLIHIVKEGIEWNMEYFWRIRAINSDGLEQEWVGTNSFTIGEYADIMFLDTQMWDETNYYPGYNLFGSLLTKKTWIMDQNGDFIWFSDILNINPLSDILPNGNMLAMNFNDGGLGPYDSKLGIEYSIDEEIVWANPDTLDAHHDMIVMPNGNYLMLVKTIQNGPIPIGSWTTNFQNIGFIADGVSIEFPWEGDRIIEINPESYEIEWNWSVFDHYSMDDYDTLGGSWNNAFDFMKYDWTHCNSLFYDENENAIYVSSRHLSRITKIDYDSGNIIWNMGHQMESDDIDMGEDICFSYQHDITILDNGNLLFLDNGNLSQFYCGTDNQVTRALELSISELNNDYIAVIEWEFLLPEEYSGSFLGSCRRLPNGNTLINPGAIDQGSSSRAFEISDNGEYIWEMSSFAIINRMYRIPGLYNQKFSVIQPNFVWYLPDPTIYLPLGDNCIHYTIINEGDAKQVYEYNFQDNGIWFNDEIGSIELDSGQSYDLIFPGSVFNEMYPHTLTLSVYPENSLDLMKNVSIDAWSTNNNESGCTDPSACNYNSNISMDDCSCYYDCLGDVNNDQSIDIFDIILIVDIILNNIEPTEFQLFTSDLNADGSIDINDILELVELILNS